MKILIGLLGAALFFLSGALMAPPRMLLKRLPEIYRAGLESGRPRFTPLSVAVLVLAVVVAWWAHTLPD